MKPEILLIQASAEIGRLKAERDRLKEQLAVALKTLHKEVKNCRSCGGTGMPRGRCYECEEARSAILQINKMGEIDG